MRCLLPPQSRPVLPFLLALATASSLSIAPVRAQSCGARGQLLKNDILPDNPTGRFQFAIVPGLCPNEAAMSIYRPGVAATIKQVAVLFGDRNGTNGVQAVVDVEIYDGITASPTGKYTLGPRVFRLSDTGSNLQIRSTALNTYTLPRPVKTTSGTIVVGFRMLQNLASGSCLLGYTANFCVDFDPSCKAGINVLDATGHGPVDPMVYGGFGQPLCPNFFRGSWVIRACIEPDISVSWTGNATPGGFVSLQFNAPGQEGNDYVAFVGGATGTLPTPWGTLPFAPGDPFFLCFLDACRGSILLNGQGRINASGKAFGALQLPSDPRLSGVTLYANFITFKLPNFTPWLAVSPVSPAIAIR